MIAVPSRQDAPNRSANASELWALNPGFGDDTQWAGALWIIPLLTVVGNLLVVISVCRERSLKTVTNFFIVNLAVSDLMVACLVMPFAVYVEVSGRVWKLGMEMCQFYSCIDVAASTASILNMTAISIDRFLAVSRPIDYMQRIRLAKRRALAAVLCVWTIAFLTAAPLALGFNQMELAGDLVQCTFTNPDYMLYSSLISFCIPAVIITTLYALVFRISRKHLSRQRLKGPHNYSAMEAMVMDGDSSRGPTVRLRTTSLSASSTYASSNAHATSTGSLQSINRAMLPVLLETLNIAFNISHQPDSGITSLRSEDSVDASSIDVSPTPPSTLPCRKQLASLNGLRKPSAELRKTSSVGFSPVPQYKLSHAAISPRVSGAHAPRRHIPPRLAQLRSNTAPNVFRQASKDVLLPSTNSSVTVLPAQLAAAICLEPAAPPPSSARSRYSFDKGKQHRMIVKAAQKRRQNREKRITRTLAIVVGVFLLCWLPFFSCHLAHSICLKLGQHCIDFIPFFLTTWLGYCNSCMNPIIYTITNSEFRRAFCNILRCVRAGVFAS